MTREKAKELLPIIKAYAEGKTIQYLIKDEWFDAFAPNFNFSANDYRIKPEPKYRPFKTKEECWNEMQEHQPFGWIKVDDVYVSIVCIHADNRIELNPQRIFIPFEKAFNEYIFADGTPFGIKEEV